MPRRAPPRLVFRAARQQDLAGLQDLNKSLFPVQYSDQFYQDLLNPEYRTVLVFCRETQLLVGAATAFMEMGDKKYSGTQTCSAYIMTLGVAEAYRGQGLGRQLLQKIVDGCEVELFTLHVKVGNKAALRMYRSFGFQVDAELQDHYTIEGQKYAALALSYARPFSWGEMLNDAITWLGGLGLCWKKQSNVGHVGSDGEC